MKLNRLVIFFLIIILLGILSVYWPQITGKAVTMPAPGYEKEPAFVTKVVDGDTIHAEINGKEETIRLLGINTPEKKMPEYQEAKDFLLYEIQGKKIELLRDFTDTDRYGRKLRYVFYENRLINVEILEQGLATSFMLDRLEYNNKLSGAEKFAKENGIGMWRKSQDKCKECIEIVELNPEDDFFIIRNKCDFNCELKDWFVKDDANHFVYLSSLNSLESKKYSSEDIFGYGTEIWNDDRDRFFMRDKDGKLVLFYEY
jgi:micrococcal nuclease